jgi:hypothetical protein
MRKLLISESIILYAAICISGIPEVLCQAGAVTTGGKQMSRGAGSGGHKLPATSNPQETVQLAPDALIRDLYKTHNRNNGQILQTKSRRLLDKYFAKNLAGLIWVDLTTHKDEVGVLDFDPFYNTQDPLIKNLSVARATVTGDKASVSVSFTNDGRKETITYLLVVQNGLWKISDLKYQSGDTLLKYFKQEGASSKLSQ